MIKAKRESEMATLIVICGFLGPFIIVGTVALLHDFYKYKKGHKSETVNE
jgi:hypothetical protein